MCSHSEQMGKKRIWVKPKIDERLEFQTILSLKMVHTWISLRNDKMNDKSLNTRGPLITRDREKAFFYGDYDLDVFLTAKKDYGDLESVVRRVIDQRGGWIRQIKATDARPSGETSVAQIMSNFGWISDSALRRMFPRKENGVIKNALVYRKDGNFSFYACETEKFYIVFCFATS